MTPDDRPRATTTFGEAGSHRPGGLAALDAIRKVAETLHQSLDFTVVAERAVDAITTYAPFICASILTLNDDEDTLELVAAKGFPDELVSAVRSVPVDGSFMGLALQERRVLLSDDLSTESRGIDSLRQKLAAAGFSRALTVPLIHADRKLGSMNLVLHRGHELSDQDRETLLSIGRAIALAAENARYVERLRRSELRYAMATAAGKVGVWDWNVASGSFYLDPNVKALLGYADDEIPNDIDAWSQHVHPDDRDRVAQAVVGCLGGRPAEFRCEHRMIHRDASLRWILARGNGVPNAAGEITRIVGTDVDITERKRLEEERSTLQQQLLHAEKLKSLGVLAGGIAHDFNNLLTGILGNAGLARGRLPDGSPAEKNVKQIEAASRRAADLTRQLLAYSGKGTFVTQSIDVSGLVREMEGLLRVSISKKAVLEHDLAPGLPPVEADPGQLHQVMMNLITNASEALKDQDGTIRVRTGVLRVDEGEMQGSPGSPLPGGRYVFVEVSDDGQGMEPVVRSRIFDPFYTTKSNGRGLGLAVVQGIVHGHRGALRVESESGRGTTITALFPEALRPRWANSHEARATAGELDGGTVLVVDDEDAVRTLAQTILEDAGFTVISARNGREAVDRFAAAPDEIRLVLLDLTMPRMSGEEAYREIRRIRSDACVIMSSGYPEDDTVRARAGDGTQEFLQKPYGPDQLIERVRQALRRRAGS